MLLQLLLTAEGSLFFNIPIIVVVVVVIMTFFAYYFSVVFGFIYSLLKFFEVLLFL